MTMGGTSTNVVLSQANFRVVRNVEAVIEINNSNLRRADVEKSAFAELLRKYPLTGSQAYINVVTEEIRRENSNLFRYWFGGQPNLKQYVAVRATIIEFLQENGEPVKSVESPYTPVPQQQAVQPTTKQPVEQEVSHATPEPAAPTTSDPNDITSLAKLDKNIYYMILLHKTSNLDRSKIEEIKQYFDYNSIIKNASKYSTKELEEKSAQHDKVFEKYAFKK